MDASRQSLQSVRISVLQFRPRKGELSANLERIREEIQKVSGETDLLLLPETILSGYFVEGGVGEVAITAPELISGLGTPPTHAPDLVLGGYERGPDGALHNSAFHLTPRGEGSTGATDGQVDVTVSGKGRGSTAGEGRRWEVVHIHRKVFLPTYGLFQEARFVTPGREFQSYPTRFGRMGMLICEEMLHSLPPTILALDGASLLVALSASPAREYRPGSGRPASLERWDLAGRSIALEHKLHLALAHLVGSEGGRIFPGGSSVYGPDGEILARAPLFGEYRLDLVVPTGRTRRARDSNHMLEDLRTFLPHLLPGLEQAARRGPARTPEGSAGSLREPSPPREEEGALPFAGAPNPADVSPLELDLPLVERALVSFLRDEIVHRRGFRKVVIGVSGGVDSAVSLLLAIRALGAENVHPLLLPYATSSPESLEHGRKICEVAGVEPRVMEITPAVDAYIQAEEPELSPLRRGNVAARFRALVLFDQSARLRALPLGTGNKSERLLGYFTWHADDSPPINPLGDLFKTQVWALARHLGVPSEVVDKAPSADLVEGVHDEDELEVDYPTADLILHWLLEGFGASELKERGFEAEAVDRVRSLLDGTHWKRALPTTALLSSSGIGDFYLRPVDY